MTKLQSDYTPATRFGCVNKGKVQMPGFGGGGLPFKGHDVVDQRPDADPLADLMVVVAGHMRQHVLAAGQTQGVEELRTAKGLALDAGPHRRIVVVHDVVGAQQHVALVVRVGAGQRAFGGVGQRAERGQHARAVGGGDHLAGREHAVADEVGDEARRRTVVQRVGVVPLFEPAAVHHADDVADGKGFELVVGDEQRRRARLVEDGADVLRQALAQVGVEAGERLVEQQQLRLRRQRARQRHALLLAAGELMRRTPRRMRQADALQHLLHARFALGARQMADAEGNVVAHVQVREQGVVLEHHADAARLGLDMRVRIGQHAAVHAHAACGQPFEPGHRAQQRGLAAARRADQHADLAFGQRQRHAGHGVVAGPAPAAPSRPRPLGGPRARPAWGRIVAAGGVAHADVAQVEKHGRIIAVT